MTFNGNVSQKASSLSNNFWEPIDSDDTSAVTFYYVLWSEWSIRVYYNVCSGAEGTRYLQRFCCMSEIYWTWSCSHYSSKPPCITRTVSFTSVIRKPWQRVWVKCSRPHNNSTSGIRLWTQFCVTPGTPHLQVIQDLQIEEEY